MPGAGRERARTGLASPSGCFQRGWVESWLGQAAAPSFLASLETAACYPAEETLTFPPLALWGAWLARMSLGHRVLNGVPRPTLKFPPTPDPCGEHCSITSFLESVLTKKLRPRAFFSSC